MSKNLKSRERETSIWRVTLFDIESEGKIQFGQYHLKTVHQLIKKYHDERRTEGYEKTRSRRKQQQRYSAKEEKVVLDGNR